MFFFFFLIMVRLLRLIDGVDEDAAEELFGEREVAVQDYGGCCGAVGG